MSVTTNTQNRTINTMFSTFDEWVIFSQELFKQEQKCRICSSHHSTDKCYKLCRLAGCERAFLRNPHKFFEHDFKFCCHKKVCIFCNKGGHEQKDCCFAPCYNCGETGHTYNNCNYCENFTPPQIIRTNYPKKWRHDPYSTTKSFVECA